MIVVTGSKGFIGGNLMALFDDAIGYDITDYTDIFDLDPTKIDRVYHMGALSSTTETCFDRVMHYNVNSSIRLFEWCIEHSIPVSYASSASVYGNSDEYNIEPMNYYALSKATIDMWVKINLDKFVDIKGYRFYNVYGDGEEHKGTQASPVHTFVKQARETGTIKIFESSGDGIRDFVWVGDVCRSMIEDRRASGIYDVGTGSPIAFSQVAKIIAEYYDAKIEVIPFPDHLQNKYQFNTKSQIDHNDFISVEEYVSRLNN